MEKLRHSDLGLWRALSCLPVLVACGASHGGPNAEEDAAVVGDSAVTTPEGGRRESCNGLDDDLDGKEDEGCPLRITFSRSEDVQPIVDGHHLAWIRSEPSEHRGSLFVKELPDGPERWIAAGVMYKALDGGRVAYVDHAARELVVLDLESGAEVRVALSREDAYGAGPLSLQGDLLVWSESHPTSGVWQDEEEVFLHDLGAGETRTLVSHRLTIQRAPRIDYPFVVWSDDRHGHHRSGATEHLFDLFALDLTAGETATQISHRSGRQQLSQTIPAFDDGRILAMETYDRGTAEEQAQVVLYTVPDGSRRELTPAAFGGADAHALSGNFAVLEMDPHGRSDLWLIDLTTDRRHQVTDYARVSTNASLDEDLLVWQDDRNDQWDLYMMDLSDFEEGDFFPEGESPE